MTDFSEFWANASQNRKPRERKDRPSASEILRNPLFITTVILGALILVVVAASILWTEVLWYRQVGASRVLWTRWGTKSALFSVFFLLQFAVLFLVALWAYRARPRTPTASLSTPAVDEYTKALAPFRKAVFVGLPAVIAVMTATGVARNWQEVLVWLRRTPFADADPQFGLNIGFYVFSLPILDMLVGFLLNTLIMSLVLSLAVNYLYGAISFQPKLRSTSSAKLQLGILAALLSLVVGLRYWLGIYSLTFRRNELADGALYADVHATLPSQMILAVISVLVAALFLVAAFRGTWRLPAVGVAVTVVSALVIGGAYPALIQQFKVTPNARALETPYIQRNIDATLKAFDMDELEYQTYAARTDASPGQLREDSDATGQIRLLDPMIIPPTVRQLQQSRPYYTFTNHMAVDRYQIGDERRDTVIAVRDIYLPGLQEQQQTWVNQRTVYTHGFGVVAAYGNTVRSDGTPAFWEQSMPSEGEMGEYEPRVYFSPNSPEYSIVGAPEGAAPQELDYPDDNAESGQVQTTFKGDGGPSIGNWWNKLLFAIKFGSTDIFFSSQINPESQILYNRDPMERAERVAPFLTLENRAYPAVVDMDDDESTPKRLVWIIDGYTTTDSYPYAQHVSPEQATMDSRSTAMGSVLEAGEVNYMRNSVKVVVDAYDGEVDMFAWDAEDPILAAWMGVYPDLVSPIDEVSGDLMAHFRYPEDIFKVQRMLLETYHVTEASEFYTGGDRWRLSEDPTAAAAAEAAVGSTQMLQPPYYLTMQMPGQDSAEFSLTSVFVPAGGGESRRAAMAGFLAVDSETGSTPGEVRDDYGQLRLIALPSSTTVPGPGQVQNNFNTDQKIATELNLLNQQGSNVRRGNLLTLPVGGGLLYVQPVYVESTSSTSYPVLRYVLTSFGDQVGFARTLAESLDQTFGGDSAATTADGAGVTAGSDAGTDAPELTHEQKLEAAILRAAEAMRESQAALADGDWAAYGRAQDKLQSALEELVALEGVVDPEAEEEPVEGDVDLGELGEDAEQATVEEG